MLQKIFLVLTVSVLLGQSVAASADMHIIFEETDTHHQHALDDIDTVSQDHEGDDCGHCCHTHGCSFSLIYQYAKFDLTLQSKLVGFHRISPYFYYTDPALRPPIS